MKISDYVESQIKGLWGTDFDENGIPVIKTNNLTYEGHIDYSDICKRNITEEQAKEWYLRSGDLLIEKSGGTKTHSVGYVSYFEGEEDKYVCNNFILALRPKNSINSKFLFYQIQFKYESNQFSDCFNKTTGIQNLKVKDYLAKEIKIYTPEEQEIIVSELDTVRSIINKNKQILEKYEILIKSRFIEMFGDIQNYTKEPFKNCSLFIDYRGHTPEVEEQGQIRMVNAKSVGKGFFKYVNEYVTEEIYDSWMHRGFPKPNDVLFVTEGHTFGNTCQVPANMNKFALGQRVITIRGNDNKLNNFFLNAYMQTDDFYKDINKYKTGGTAQGIRSKDLLKIEIPLPPIELQQRFSIFVQQIDKSKFAVQKSLEKAETLYKSLMQEYFG